MPSRPGIDSTTRTIISIDGHIAFQSQHSIRCQCHKSTGSRNNSKPSSIDVAE
ncbi:MAG: hypothetical protein IPH68_15605 [Chitinophagaceae bacterium]|nr:hypothetical protein [Chitinophagaceae bacterium]